jgi:exonuclease SbcC
MRIDEILMHNIKGQRGSQKLTGRDIIQGKNGSGKTTRNQAIGLAMLGYVPGNGKTSQETFKLASDDFMEVGLKLDDGFEMSRNYTREEKENTKTFLKEVSIYQKINVAPSMGERLNSDKEKRIIDELGNFPVMLDFNEFLSLSDSKRRDFFYSMSPVAADSWNKDVIARYLEDELLTFALKDSNPDKYSIMFDAINKTMDMYPVRFDVQAGLTAMIDYVSKQLSAWKKDKINSFGAVKKLSEIKNELEQTDRGIKNNKDELEQLQVKLLIISTQIAADTEKRKAMDKKNIELAALKIDLKKVTADTCENVDELKALLESKGAELKDIISYYYKRQELTETIQTLREEHAVTNTEIENFKETISKESAEIKFLIKNRDAIIANSGHCVIDAKIECSIDSAKYVEDTRTKLLSLKSSVNESVEKANKTIEKRNNLWDSITQAETDIKNTYVKEAEETKLNNDTRVEITSIERRISDTEKFEESKAAKIQAINTKLSALESEPVEAIIDLEIATKHKAGLEVHIRDLKAKIEEQNKAKITLSNLQQSMIDAKQAAHYADCYKMVADKLGPKGIQGEIVKSILEPIKVDIQSKLDVLTGAGKQFFFSTESDTGKEIFQFGWRNELEERLNFDALSTGEKLMLLVALIVVIVERNNPKLKILMIDNIENLDHGNLVNLLEGLNIVGDKLDNIIISGVIDINSCCDFNNEYMGFKVWDLEVY